MQYIPRKNINGGLLILFSLFFPPGANYMYMGLIKRGLAAMSGFFLLIYLLITSFTGGAIALGILFSLSLPVLWFACFFDGFHIRRRINDGEVVEDGIGDVLSSLFRNKTLALILLIIIGIAFAGTILGVAAELIRRAVPVILVVFALYVIFRKRR
jgi:hypothetical protein